MKKILFTLALGVLINALTYAQVPEYFNYQTIVRDADGLSVNNQTVSFRVAIIWDALVYEPQYIETHTVQTNGFGLAILRIGDGTPTFGAFNAIDWATGNLFLEIGIDPNGGTEFLLMGATELLAVPYAQYAIESGNAYWKKIVNDIYYLDGTVGIGTDAPIAPLTINGVVGPDVLFGPDFETDIISHNNMNIGSYDPFSLNLITQNLPRLTINGDGDVGIGTETPLANLHLDGGYSDAEMLISSNNHPRITLSESTSSVQGFMMTIDLDDNLLNFFGQSGSTYYGPHLSINRSSTLVGIGESLPINTLDVKGSAAIGTGYTGDYSAPANGLIVEGDVGIGTTTPDAKLHVEAISGFGQMGATNYAVYGQHFSGSYGYIGGSNVGGYGHSNILYGLWGSTNSGNAIYGTVSGTGYAGYFSGKGYFSGNLGIGTTDPALKLHIDGGTDLTLPSGGYLMVGAADGVNISMDNNEIMSKNNGTASPLHINQEGGNTLFNELSGNVGIGTNTPTSKLHVSGTVQATSFSGDGSSLTGVGDNLGNHSADQNILLSGNWLSGDGGDEGVFVANNGNVGIGSATTPNRLYIKSSGETFLGIERAEGGNGGIAHYETGTSQAKWIFPFFRGWQSDNLIVRLESSLTDVMTFEYATGNFGINTLFDNPPTEKLHVEGNIYLNGTIKTAAKTGTLSVGPVAFTCSNNSKGYTIFGNLIRNDDLFSDNDFYAQVQLPQGAVITSLTSYWIDNAPCSGELSLERIETATGNWVAMATTQYSIWESGAINSSVTTSFNYSTIDNDTNFYYIQLSLCNDPALWFMGLKIEYTYTTIQ